jgi:hypothetical protein
MKKLHRHVEGEPSAPTPPAGRLGGVRPMSHDDDERQSGADLNYGQTIFTRPPVPLPRLLRGGKRKPKG